MAEKKQDFMSIITSIISHLSHFISASIFPKISEGAEMVMDTIEERILIIEQRILRKIYSFSVIVLGSIFLIFALLFYLKEFLGWSNTAAFFSIGIVFFVAGLLLRLGNESRRA